MVKKDKRKLENHGLLEFRIAKILKKVVRLNPLQPVQTV
jgi:hypothetical protein